MGRRAGPTPSPPPFVKGDWLDTELGRFEVYCRQETTAHRITAYSLEVCDSLPNVGPCGRVAQPARG